MYIFQLLYIYIKTYTCNICTNDVDLKLHNYIYIYTYTYSNMYNYILTYTHTDTTLSYFTPLIRRLLMSLLQEFGKASFQRDITELKKAANFNSRRAQKCGNCRWDGDLGSWELQDWGENGYNHGILTLRSWEITEITEITEINLMTRVGCQAWGFSILHGVVRLID